jgi:hypothetical protein
LQEVWRMLGRLQAGQHMEYGPVLMAQLRGKLPTDVWLSSEDLLTSAVFGTLKNLPDPIAAALLSRAQPLEGPRPLVLSPPLRWRFWPSWDICEPDVVLEDDENLCVIEAKLYSDFGEHAPAGSQLRREWTDGLRRAQDAGKEVWLVALTNHTTVPQEAIKRQLARADAEPCRVCWLSWLEVGRFLRNLKDDPTSGWAEDLLELLSRMGLAPFDGFARPTSYPAGVLWLDGVVLREERPGTIGFRAAMALARGLGPALTILWRLAPAPAGWERPASFGAGTIGFGQAISAAREGVRRGGAQWLLRLT